MKAGTYVFVDSYGGKHLFDVFDDPFMVSSGAGMTKSASELLRELDKVAATFPGVALDDNIPPPIKEALIAIGTLRGALPELRAVVEAAEAVGDYIIGSKFAMENPFMSERIHNIRETLTTLREKLE